ncbi:MAG: hypothetical protein RR778_08840, partial [Glutamicibacter sp.]|uniref:hypothetical protein n=1 Tax=Glutamicibacter sp. TaxID=1931995 RepID=UPI002FC8D17F
SRSRASEVKATRENSSPSIAARVSVTVLMSCSCLVVHVRIYLVVASVLFLGRTVHRSARAARAPVPDAASKSRIRYRAINRCGSGYALPA